MLELCFVILVICCLVFDVSCGFSSRATSSAIRALAFSRNLVVWVLLLWWDECFNICVLVCVYCFFWLIVIFLLLFVICLGINLNRKFRRSSSILICRSFFGCRGKFFVCCWFCCLVFWVCLCMCVIFLVCCWWLKLVCLFFFLFFYNYRRREFMLCLWLGFCFMVCWMCMLVLVWCWIY